MPSEQILDPLLRELCARLNELYSSRAEQLAKGAATALPESRATTSENYAAHVSYLKAIEDVASLCKEIDVQRYGARPGEEESDERR
jgi:hypothetical protein